MCKSLSHGGLIGFCFLSISLVAFAQPVTPPDLSVVYDSGRTVDATRYYAGRMRSSETPKNMAPLPAAPAAPARSLDLADNLPLRSAKLQPGQLEVRELEGLYTPFFVLGMDEQSLTWFEEAATTLAAMNATGFIVEAHSRSKWASLQAFARDHGIRVSLLNGDGLAKMYGFRTYPTVFVPPGGGQ